MIQFYSDITISDENRDLIMKSLPCHWKTDVKHVYSWEDMEILIKINAKTIEETNEWLTDFQNNTNSTYSVQNTRKCTGEKLMFKKRFNCHHHTRRKETHDPIHRQRVKNTNCPSYIVVSMRVVGKRYRGKNKNNAPDPDKPCEIKLKMHHNHSLTDGIGPMFKRVSLEIKDKLLSLYQQGHTASTALARIKSDIRLNHENYAEILVDRSRCPDYRYCHYIFHRYFSKSSSALVLNEDFLENKLRDYNNLMKEESAKMALSDSGYVICVSPPFVKRIHKYNPSASTIVFINTITNCNKIGSKIHVLLTNSEIGAVPLGLIISTSKSQRINLLGFSFLKEMLGESAFGGNIQGPEYFIIDEQFEQSILNIIWPQSKILYSMSNVVQNVWKWLSYGKNQIPNESKIKFMSDFCNMVYASSEEEFMQKYISLKESCVNYSNYLKLINDYFERRHLWGYCYRNIKLKENFSEKSYSEILLRIFKITDLKWFKSSWTIFQLVDFIINNFFQFFEQKILKCIKTGIVESVLKEKIQMPPLHILQKIQILSNKIQIVPSENSNELIYCVNSEILNCSCFNNMSGALCKHVQWMCLLLHEDIFKETLVDISKIRSNFCQILDLETNESTTLDIYDLQNNLLFENAIIVEVESDVELLQIDNKEELIEEGKQIWNNITEIYEKFLQESPEEILTTTKQILKKFENVKTTEEFCSLFNGKFKNQNIDDKKLQINNIQIQSSLENYVIINDCLTEEPPNKKNKLNVEALL